MQYRVSVNGKPFDVVVESVSGSSVAPAAPAYVAPVAVPAAPIAAPVAVAAPAGADERVLSPMPGNIWQIPVAVGQAVAAGQCLIILEAMKMENEIVAPRAGMVKQILVSKGSTVNTDDVLIVLG